MAVLNVNNLQVPEVSSHDDVPTPAEGHVRIYIYDGSLYQKDSSGTPVAVGSDGGTSVSASDVTYAPTTGGDWEASPDNAADAFDELAGRVKTLEENGESGGGDASATTYTPTTSGDWDTSPENVEEALDELADRVTDLENSGGGGGEPGTLRMFIGEAFLGGKLDDEWGSPEFSVIVDEGELHDVPDTRSEFFFPVNGIYRITLTYKVYLTEGTSTQVDFRFTVNNIPGTVKSDFAITAIKDEEVSGTWVYQDYFPSTADPLFLYVGPYNVPSSLECDGHFRICVELVRETTIS